MLLKFLTAMISTTRYIMLRKGAINQTPTNKKILTTCFAILISYSIYTIISVIFTIQSDPPLMAHICAQLNDTAGLEFNPSDLLQSVSDNWHQFLFIVPGIMSLITSLSFDWKTKKFMNCPVHPNQQPAGNDVPLQAINQQGL
jgi:hypothetical protein